MIEPHLINLHRINLINLAAFLPIPGHCHTLGLPIFNLLVDEVLHREETVARLKEHSSIVDFDLRVGVLWAELKASHCVGLTKQV